jgi:sugar phosphate isomerase/epimerase
MNTPLAVQLYSVRDLLADDRASVLGGLAEIGYAAVEVADPTDDPLGLRVLADDLGLEVCAVHASALARGMDAAEIFDAVHILGSDLVIIPAGIPRDEFASRDGVKRAADLLNSLAAQATKHGLRLGYHNHEHELESILDGRHAFDVLVDLMSPEIFLEIDTYWAAVGGVDVPGLLATHGDRVRLLHVKDGPGTRDESNVAVGSGAMAVPDFLAAAPHAWRVVEFDHCNGDIMDALRASFAYLNSVEIS